MIKILFTIILVLCATISFASENPPNPPLQSSHTIVSNNQVAEDLLYAAVRGKIGKVEIIKEGRDKKLKALIKEVER
ncbi:MAG: hypothetical protein M1147_03680 [Nitrospirae bacterium]|nr:hypothetical protein [Nitrospirota bacterium]MCL5977216.1 hypothetical protein [Nitrospirota bacterium]